MRKPFMIAAALATATAGCSAGADRGTAEAAVVEFRQMMDAGRFAEIYRASAPDMKSTTSEAELVRVLGGVHTHYGNFRTASQTDWNWNSSNGNVFVTLRYDTQYMNGRAAERFVYRIQDGDAQLAGYNINVQSEAGNTQVPVGNGSAPNLEAEQ